MVDTLNMGWTKLRIVYMIVFCFDCFPLGKWITLRSSAILRWSVTDPRRASRSLSVDKNQFNIELPSR